MAVMDRFEEQVSDDKLLRGLRVLSIMAEEPISHEELLRGLRFLSAMTPPIDSSRRSFQEFDSNRSEYDRILANDAQNHMNAQSSQLG